MKLTYRSNLLLKQISSILKNYCVLVIAVSLLLLVSCNKFKVSLIRPGHLLCNMIKNPIGIEPSTPLLSWQLESQQINQMQKAYLIIVSSSIENLNANQGDIWNSGKCNTDQSLHIRYLGKELKSNTTYFWKVKVWDMYDNSSRWSDMAYWHTSLFGPSEWKGNWIAAIDKTDTSRHPAFLFRKEFNITKEILNAYAYISGLGYSELYINGKKIGKNVLDPGFSDYTKTVYYDVHNISDNLINNRNTVGIILGGGWYNLATPDLFGNEKAQWTNTPRLLINIIITYKDHSQDIITSDSSWRWSESHITFNCVRGGEDIDNRLIQNGWNQIGFNDKKWKFVIKVEAPKGRLTSFQQKPVIVSDSLTPVSITEPRKGIYVFDLGKNIAGWMRLKTSGKAGQKIKITCNEKLLANGTVDLAHEAYYHTHGRFQTEYCILSGKTEESFEPRFTYHGLRYIQVEGLSQKPDSTTIKGMWVHTDMEETGSFSCSNEKFNKLYNAYKQTYLNYVHHQPADALREKMGWTQDAENMMESGLYCFDLGLVYRKWQHDFVDAQESNGHVPCVAPTTKIFFSKSDNSPGYMSDTWWGGAIVYLPWMWYLNFGDVSILTENYPFMKKWIDYLSTQSKDYTIDWGLGDWGAIGCKVPLIQPCTCGYYYETDLLSKIAAILGKDSDKAKYDSLANKIKDKYTQKFYNSKWKEYSLHCQSAQSIPLYVGLVPDSLKQFILDNLNKDIISANNHLAVGFVGLTPLLIGLSENDQIDQAYIIASQETYPSWWPMISDGFNTVSEYWDPNIGSRNIPNITGPLCLWFYRNLAGIHYDEQKPGFKKIIIKPEMPCDLTWVNSSFNSLYGIIESNWKRENESLEMNITIPVNTTADIYIPSENVMEIKMNGQPVKSSKDLKYLGIKDGKTLFNVGSGHYTFIANCKQPKVLTPVIFPNPYERKINEKCSIQCYTNGASIHYTTDNSEPDENSTEYKQSFEIQDGMIIKAKAFKEGFIESNTINSIFSGLTCPSLIEKKIVSKSLTPLYNTGLLKYNHSATKIDLNIQDAAYFMIEVNEGDGRIDWDHAVLGNARFIDLQGNEIYLNNISPVFFTGKLKINRSIDGNVLSVNHVQYRYGLGLHSPEYVYYKTDKKYKQFKAEVGVDDETEGRPTSTFKLLFYKL